jgi:hypothetical protein
LLDLKRLATYSRNYNHKLRDKVLLLLGGRCSNPNCGWINEDGTRGCTDKRCLQIDHVNGGGTREHRELRGGNSLLLRVLADVEGKYQLLCANCNWIKRHVNDEVPNKRR